MKNLLILALACAAIAAPALSAQERGWIAGVEYEQSNYKSAYVDGFTQRGSLRSYGFKISGAYNFTFPVVKGLFVRPKVNLNFRWGDQREILYYILFHTLIGPL